MSKFSDITVFIPKGNDGPSTVKARGTFVYDDTFKINYTLFKGPKGLFVGLPGQYGNKIDEKTGKKISYSNIST